MNQPSNQTHNAAKPSTPPPAASHPGGVQPGSQMVPASQQTLDVTRASLPMLSLQDELPKDLGLGTKHVLDDGKERNYAAKVAGSKITGVVFRVESFWQKAKKGEYRVVERTDPFTGELLYFRKRTMLVVKTTAPALVVNKRGVSLAECRTVEEAKTAGAVMCKAGDVVQIDVSGAVKDLARKVMEHSALTHVEVEYTGKRPNSFGGKSWVVATGLQKTAFARPPMEFFRIDRDLEDDDAIMEPIDEDDAE